ncbi:hypothetical protein D3C86_1712720 [compost metagenome]
MILPSLGALLAAGVLGAAALAAGADGTDVSLLTGVLVSPQPVAIIASTDTLISATALDLSIFFIDKNLLIKCNNTLVNHSQPTSLN